MWRNYSKGQHIIYTNATGKKIRCEMMKPGLERSTIRVGNFPLEVFSHQIKPVARATRKSKQQLELQEL
jgi:hypothetical protein